MNTSSLTQSSPRSEQAGAGRRPGKHVRRTACASAAAAVAVTTLGLTGVVAASAVASSPAGTATWRPGPAGIAGETTAVTGVHAHGTTTEFAFVFNYPTHHLYIRTNGGVWIRTSGPALAKDERVVAARAITAHHLVAFTVLRNGTSRVLDYNRGKWTVIGRFSEPIGTATVLSAANIWVFGSTEFTGSRVLGVWHYNGTSWQRIAARGTGGSGVTATSAWAVRGTVAEHYADGKWTGTNLRSLIPAVPSPFGFKSLIGISATPGSPVYAVGDGGREDSGGPLVVLRFNGHRWAKVARYSHGNPWAVSTDGKGGLILAGTSGAGAQAQLLHYARGSGRLVAESVPGMTNVVDSTFETAANVAGTTVLIVGGATPVKTGNFERATIYTTN